MSGEDTNDRRDPHGRHRFLVRTEALDPMGFLAVQGLAVSVEAGSKAKESSWWERLFSGPFTARKTTSPPLELVRGIRDDLPLWQWLQEWVEGSMDARDVEIYLLSATGEVSVGWIASSAKPIEWTGPTLEADRAEVATETLKLAHDGLSATTDPPAPEEFEIDLSSSFGWFGRE